MVGGISIAETPRTLDKEEKIKETASNLKKDKRSSYFDEKQSKSGKKKHKSEFEFRPKELLSKKYIPPYGNLLELNTKRLIVDSVGESFLEEIVNFYLDALQTSAAVYETNGDYAIGIFSSAWCRFLDQASRKLCETEDNRVALDSGKWLCHESCWTQASKKSVETGKPVDIECYGGLHIYAIPIWAGKEIVGSINFGYGNPSKTLQDLQPIANRYKVPVDQLLGWAEAYPLRPPSIIESSKKRLEHSAKLIGAAVLQRIQLDNLQKTFIVSASHELRTPLSVIIQSIDNLMKYRHKLPEEEQLKLMEMLSRNAISMNQLLDGLLLITFIDQGKFTLNWIPYHPLEILKSVLRELEPLQRNKGLTTEYDVNEDLQLYGDPKHISQIFRIIIDNAIKYSNKNGKIRVKAIDHYLGKYNENNLDGVLFEIKDEGCGIKESEIPLIFNRFFRGEGVSNIQDTGLGLSIACELTELHQGEINVESIYGVGSTFFIFLPRLTSPPSFT